MWHELYDWAFHWILLWVAFELGRRWNEKDVAESIAAITEIQTRRWSQETSLTSEKVSLIKPMLIAGSTEVPWKFNWEFTSIEFSRFGQGETTTLETCVLGGTAGGGTCR
jgi:hypothetical protein